MAEHRWVVANHAGTWHACKLPKLIGILLARLSPLSIPQVYQRLLLLYPGRSDIVRLFKQDVKVGKLLARLQVHFHLLREVSINRWPS